ncbi:unnamed protein product [Hymenolepis diminuta]|uniref:Uncharacterized protein n=1 Tax=Hymenolepis diminuta TaxID=6216 RepID=A0A564Z8M5_HYMDI|nr:unnamed protein product [Hymenolepis diminuta]
MPSIIKQQILKPLAVFAKNLDLDRIKLSALKGELNMENLELNEEVLMDFLEFPMWMRINSAVCSKIAVKIPWTNLRSKPIFMVIDSVDVKVEVLEKPRQPIANGSASSYRPSSGRYGLVERAIDGISLRIHELSAELMSKVFKASVNLSHITLTSKKPNWDSGPFDATFIPVPERNSILIFKEVSWESTHLKADGLDERLTPVKIITNRAHLRLVLKKRLSDSSFVCGKIILLIESLLWILSVSQLEAAILFLKFLKRSMESASGANLFKMKPTALNSLVSIDPTIGTPGIPRSSDPRLIQAFDYFDVKENSFHLEANLIETHFCEDNLRTSSMSTQLVEGGFVRMTMKNLHFDHYPAHPKAASRKDWTDYSETDYARSQWLQSLKPLSDPDSYICRHLSNPKIATIFESVVVFRIQDITVACVMLDNQKEEERWPLPFNIAKNHKRRTVLETLDGEQKSLISNTFIASDTLMHKLPVKTNLITMDFTQCLSSESANTVLPMILFAQINPLHMKLDVDTVIWLNAFLLNLTANLQSLFGETENTFSHQMIPPLFCHAEALMPRVIFPMAPPPRNANNSDIAEYPWTGPSALVMQIDQVIVQTVPRPLTASMAKALTATLDNLEKQKKPPPAWGRDHILPDFSLFRKFVEQHPPNLNSNSQEPNGLLLCLHCPSVWAEFLTICEAAQRHSSAAPSFKTYRQAFFDPAPFTSWALAPSWPLWSRPPSAPRYSVTWSPDLGRRLTSPPSLPAPISLLIDLDTSANPLSIYSSSLSSPSKSKPLHFTIGHSGAVFTFRPVERLRLPDAVDHLVFLYGLAFRLARLKASMGLDSYDIMARQEGNGEVKRYHEWLITAKCLVTHGVEVEVTSTVDSRYVDPPADYLIENEGALSSLSSGSSTKPPIDPLLKPVVEDDVNSTLSSFGEKNKDLLVSEPPISYGSVTQGAQGMTGSSSGIFDGGPLVSLGDGSILDDSSVITHSDSFELILPDDEAFNEVFINSFDEIIPDEMGVDIANSEDIEERSNTIMDEEQAVNFPPWKVQRLMLDLKGLSIDADISTIEARLWIGVAFVGFFDPDDLEDDPVGSDNDDETEVKSDISNISNPLSSSPAFLITLRFGGDSLPGQPQTLLSPYDGWMAMHVGMMEETTLYPVPTSWEVLEALLGHWTSRGGARAFNNLVTHGPGAGSIPMTNPPQLLDLTFCLEKGNLVLDLTARPRKWGKRLKRDGTLLQNNHKAPIQKIKLLQGFSASLNSERVLEVCGALPMLDRTTTFTRSSPQPSTASMSPNNGSQSPITPTNINSLNSLNSSPNGTSPLIANRFQPSNTLPMNVNLAGSPNSPPVPPRRVFSRGPSLRRSQIGQILQPPSESETSLAEQNAKLHLMVNRLQSQVLALTTDLTRLKTQYSK